MDENASRAVFLGVSVLVAIITITLIVSFYRTAKDSAAVANRYDISGVENKNVNDVLEKKEITGIELRYILNYFQGSKDVDIIVEENGMTLEIYDDDIEKYESNLEQKIKPNYNYNLKIEEIENKYKVIAEFIY